MSDHNSSLSTPCSSELKNGTIKINTDLRASVLDEMKLIQTKPERLENTLRNFSIISAYSLLHVVLATAMD